MGIAYIDIIGDYFRMFTQVINTNVFYCTCNNIVGCANATYRRILLWRRWLSIVLKDIEQA